MPEVNAPTQQQPMEVLTPSGVVAQQPAKEGAGLHLDYSTSPKEGGWNFRTSFQILQDLGQGPLRIR
ncbi:hypothetical protein VMCG_01100 [Cytospora schulzeri]|uniref:Uncharacterized protein n=1 Tax=Cytospora schulzeri TaxID=448051 RepID=A0A423X6U2_9PEZI|nr:hypothetical protein VMCG_01100 [Valsa malicola]